MMLRTIALAVAAFILIPLAAPAHADLGGVQHAQRLAAELALRKYGR